MCCISFTSFWCSFNVCYQEQLLSIPNGDFEAVMKARYLQNMINKWVVMTTTILNVKIIAILYYWSQNDMSYIVTIMGTTQLSLDLYKSHYEGIFGELNTKLISCPKVLAFVYGFLPGVDTHNHY